MFKNILKNRNYVLTFSLNICKIFFVVLVRVNDDIIFDIHLNTH